MMIKFDGKHWYEAIDVDIYDLDNNYLGYCYFPKDVDLLDIIDDPATVWASDNGYCVDEIDYTWPYL